MRGAASERGIDFAQSSSWDLYRQSAMDAEFDALTIRRKGEVQALGLVAQSQGSRFAARQAGKAATYGAGASALATAAAAADGYGTYKYRTAGRTTGGEVD
jgi:hypothetical protein